MHLLKPNFNYCKQNITLETNAPVSIYIAIELHKPNILPSEFQDTQDMMTVYKVSRKT